MRELTEEFDSIIKQVEDYLFDARFDTDSSYAGTGEAYRDIEEYIAGTQPPFRQVLTKFIRETGQDDSAIYTRAFIDRRLFSKIRGPGDYHPGKGVVICISLALRLDDKKTEALLSAAGYSLSRSSRADMIVRFFIEHRLYDVLLVNRALDHFGEKLLTSVS